MLEEHYQPNQLEPQIQQQWEESGLFCVSKNDQKEKFYCLSMLPYPSGKLHMGHVRNYTIGDVITRYQWMCGKNVLQPIGWDAFGLPAENAAIQHKTAPAKWTYENIDHMRMQLKTLGFAYDWSREIATCHPKYYRWEQQLFTKMFKKGLAYKKLSIVNWDPVDQTVLANEQVINGCGWRSGAPIERREISQWFLKITDYSEELLNDIDKLDGWPDEVRTMQRNWIGRSEGVEITFQVENQNDTLSVYTTRPDTFMGATFVAIAAQHSLATLCAEKNELIQKFVEECKHIKVAEADFATMEKKGIDSGLKAIHPLTGELIPIWITNYVLIDYGTGAVMAVPAHDERDYDFAKKYGLAIKQVITPNDESTIDISQQAYTQKGRLINSGEFSNLTSEEAFNAIANALEKLGAGKRTINYRLRDWGISRQRYWGAPIPIIYCDDCGAVPVPDQDLPVVLPENVEFTGTTSPLNTMPEFYEVPCPTCGKKAKRETDTFDTFMESSWYYARYTCPDQDKAMLDERADYWVPVDQYIGGIEHACMHLLYARFLHKIMRDFGLVHSDEPFTKLLTQGMVLKDGSKMSKSKGNTVDPESLINQYGVDTVRLFIIFAAPPEQSLEWSDSGVEGAYRFLKRLWRFAFSHQEELQTPAEIAVTEKNARREIHLILQQANNDIQRLQFNTVVSACMKLLNLIEENQNAAIMREGMNILLRVLNPITPHIAQVLWKDLGFGDNITLASWPKVDEQALQSDTIELVIQINGKKRTQITVPSDSTEEQIKQAALADDKVQQSTADKEIRRIIVVRKKLVNIVV